MAAERLDEGALLSRRRFAVLLFAILVLLSTRLIGSALKADNLLTADSPILYHAAVLGFNYVDFGFVRRGLAGTLLWPFGSRLLLGAAVFHMVSAALLAAVACRYQAGLRRPWSLTLVYALVIVALTMRWAEDAGRTDLLVAALIGLAAMALIAGRVVPAFACLGVGLAVHETAYLFGVPMLAGVWLAGRISRPIPARSWAAGAAVIVATLAIYSALDHLPHADRQTMVDTVRSRLPRHEYVDWAIYFAVAGGRGVRMAICQNAGDPAFAVHLFCGLAAIALCALVLKERSGPSWPALLIVSVPPVLFLSVVANDMSRWTVFGAFNIWLLAAAHAHQPHSTPLSATSLVARLAVAALLIPLIHPRTWRILDPIFAPMPAVERLVTTLGGPRTPRFATAIERCDPSWRQVLGDETRPPGQ